MPFYIVRKTVQLERSGSPGQMTVIVDNQGYETPGEAQVAANAGYPGEEWEIVEASEPAEAALRVAGASPGFN